MKKSKCFWIALSGFLGGIILGFLISPVKKCICNKKGNMYYCCDDDDDVEPEGLA